MAKLTGPLIGVNDTGKVLNRKVAKSQIVLILPILIINVGRTLILGLPRKQDGRPVGYITLLTLISRPNRGVKNFLRHICGPLPMAILTGPLMSVNDTGKVRNRKVAKSQIVLLLLLILIINVGRTLILGLPRKQDGRPVGYITVLTLISRPNGGVKNF